MPAEQPRDSAPTLEIRSATRRQSAARTEVPDSREFRKSQDVAPRQSNSIREDADHAHNPYIGISVEYSTHCYANAEDMDSR